VLNMVVIDATFAMDSSRRCRCLVLQSFSCNSFSLGELDSFLSLRSGNFVHMLQVLQDALLFIYLSSLIMTFFLNPLALLLLDKFPLFLLAKRLLVAVLFKDVDIECLRMSFQTQFIALKLFLSEKPFLRHAVSFGF